MTFLPAERCAREHSACDRPRARGTSLLEAIVAVGVGAAVVAATTGAIARAARTVADAREQTQATTLARNALDTALAAPCAPAGGGCAPGWRCTMTTTPLFSRTAADEPVVVERVQAEVARDATSEPRPAVAFTTVRARPASCP